MPRRMRFDADDFDKYGYTIGCPGCRAKNRGDISVNHSEECRQRIEQEIREDDPERYNRALGRLAEGILKESTLRQGRGDERQVRDIEVRKKTEQKEDWKEERKEDIRKKADEKHITNRGLKSEDVFQGECMDTSKTWICPKCKTKNEESYKFCMECANRNPKRNIEEVA